MIYIAGPKHALFSSINNQLYKLDHSNWYDATVNVGNNCFIDGLLQLIVQKTKFGKAMQPSVMIRSCSIIRIHSNQVVVLPFS